MTELICQGKRPGGTSSKMGSLGLCLSLSVMSWQSIISHTGFLKQQKCIFSLFWRIEVQDQGVGIVGFFWGLTWLVDGHLLPLSWPSLVHVIVLISSYKDTTNAELKPNPKASFNSISHILSHILKYGGLYINIWIGGGKDTIKPTTVWSTRTQNSKLKSSNY